MSCKCNNGNGCHGSSQNYNENITEQMAMVRHGMYVYRGNNQRERMNTFIHETILGYLSI